MYYKENRKEVRQMCQIVEEYGDLMVARATVEHVKNLMNNGHMGADKACALLGISLDNYKAAKKLLSSEVSS